jgi:hypothetical protein
MGAVKSLVSSIRMRRCGSRSGDSTRRRLRRHKKKAATSAIRTKTPTTGPTIAPIGVDLWDGGGVMDGEGVDEAEVEAEEVDPGGFGVTRK